MTGYIKRNLLAGFRTAPTRALAFSVVCAVVFFALALSIGFRTGLLAVDIMDSSLVYAVPFILFVFPSLLEESVFRGLLIPNDTRERGPKAVIGYTLFSTVLFVAWHPLNALTINPGAQAVFLDGYFLLIAAFLGIATGLAYIMSRSLWVPIIIHWLTVIAWVVFLGGRNLLAGML